MGDYKKILFSRDHAITTVTFNRPGAHNALDREMSDELAEAVRAVKRDRDCRFLIFRGAGDTFCAGDDIKDFLTWTEDDPYWQARQYQETAQMIEDLTPITIAAVDGVCTGGGLELTLVCDFVVATDRSRWGMPEIDWDITPGWAESPGWPDLPDGERRCWQSVSGFRARIITRASRSRVIGPE